MNTCHGSTAPVSTRANITAVEATATERATIITAQRLARSAIMPEIRAKANMGIQRKTKSKATWNAESVRSNTRRPMTTVSIQRPALSRPPAAHISRKSRRASSSFTQSPQGLFNCSGDRKSAIGYVAIPRSVIRRLARTRKRTGVRRMTADPRFGRLF